MRSKSTRDSTKLSPQRPTGTSDSSVRKHSRRHRKSSSSSTGSSDGEQNRKTARTSITKHSSPENDKPPEFLVKVCESSRSPKASESTKHVLDKSHRSSSRHTHKKSGSFNEDEGRSSMRKSRRRGHSDEHARSDITEDTADKISKGKSKSKHKSKNEKQPQIQDLQAKSESEISENVQVTPQSPKANITIPVDNDTERDENETLHESSKTLPVAEFNTKHNSDSNDSNEYQGRKHSDSDEAPQNADIFGVNADRVEEGSMEWQPVEQEIVLEAVSLHGNSESVDEQEEISQDHSRSQLETVAAEVDSNGASELVGVLEPRPKSSSPEAGVSPDNADRDNAPHVVAADESNNAFDLHRSDDDSRSVDAIVLHESSSTPPRHNKFNLSESYNDDVREIDYVNHDIQNIKDGVGEMFGATSKPTRKHKWGNSLVGLELIRPTMKNITIKTIKEFCPNVAFLEENQIKLTSERRERKVERQVSMEYKSDEETSRRYDTQSSHEEVSSEIDHSNIIAMNRKISIVEDTASKLRPPPSPARNPISQVLFVSNLVRPFTLKQLKELLERTGRIRENGFWTDRIKSKCYVHYESSEDAEITRNALHGVYWPIGNGKQLLIEYSTPDEFEKARNPAPTPAPLEKPTNSEKENIEKQVPIKRVRLDEPEKVLKEKERHRSEGRSREWETSRDEMRHRRSRSRRNSRNREIHNEPIERNDRRRNRRTVTPPGDYRSRKQKLKEEEPQKLMDDLFHKTKAVPSVYWLPLTPEEIATKQQERLQRMAEHKRRIEESTRNRGDHGRGAPFRRRYD